MTELTHSDLTNLFSNLLSPRQVLTGDALVARSSEYCEDAYACGILLLPNSVQDVSRIAEVANEHAIGVVPHGGMTGLVQGTASAPGQVVISFERMNRIIRLDPEQGIAEVEAGVTLQSLIDACAEFGLMPGMDIPSRGSCTIGGLVSTNAGGIHVIRYGMTRENILGLEAVLADGTIIDAMNTLIKNNAGYNLGQLFVGAEGTLGLVTKAVVKLVAKPRTTQTALIACESIGQIVSLLGPLRRTFDNRLLSFEVMWPEYYEITTAQPGFGSAPLATGHGIYAIVEIGSWGSADDDDALSDLLAAALEGGQISDAVLAQSEQQSSAIWRSREDSEAIVRSYPKCLNYDVGMEVAAVEPYVAALRGTLACAFPEYLAHVYGHIGDGNLHITIGAGEEAEIHHTKLDQIVYGALSDVNTYTTISAEHGIGLEKRSYLALSRGPDYLKTMRTLKSALDPNGILNRGKVLA